MKRILVINDETRKNDDISYLLDRMSSLTENDDFVIITIEGMSHIIDKISTHKKNVITYPNNWSGWNSAVDNSDYLVVMPTGMFDGPTASIMKKFSHKRDVHNIFTF